MKEITTGALHSSIDYRDRIATASVMDQFASISWLPQTLNTVLGPVQMQAKQPACVSFSMVELLKLYWFRKTGQWIDFCPRFLHALSAFPGATPADGRDPRTVLKLLRTVGCCTTATLPNDVTIPLDQYCNPVFITQAMRDEAAKYRIPGYIPIPLDYQSIRMAMFLYGAVSVLFSVGSELYLPSWLPKDTDPLRTPNPVISGHQMTAKGWSGKSLNLLRNEWSAGWANNGETEYDPIAWTPFTYEAWAITDISEDITNFLKVLPSPKNFSYRFNFDMKMGDYSDDVKFAQVALMILGYLKPINPADLGYFGPKTAAGVLAFQSASGISPLAPNSIGPKTRAALNKQFNN